MRRTLEQRAVLACGAALWHLIQGQHDTFAERMDLIAELRAVNRAAIRKAKRNKAGDNMTAAGMR